MKDVLSRYLASPKPIPFVIAAAFFTVVATVTLGAETLWREPAGLEPPVIPVIAESLFSTYLGAFEVMAVLLVAALVAGVYLAKPDVPREERLEDTVETKIRTDADEAQESLERRRQREDEDGST